MTIVKGDQKALFSIDTTTRCRGGRYSFPWIVPLYPWYIPYIDEFLARRNQIPFLKSLVWRDLGVNPGLPDDWGTHYPLGQWAGRGSVKVNLTIWWLTFYPGKKICFNFWHNLLFFSTIFPIKKTSFCIPSAMCPAGWGCRIHRLHLCGGVRLHQRFSCIWH